MNTHLLALQLMAVQGCLGAFDTLYHHELTEALPQRPGARRELSIHAARALLYSLLFAGLSAWRWQGAWALVLMVVFGVEIVLTLWDFVVEDQTRLLPATERVTHSVLAINGGAFIALLALNLPDWLAAPTGFGWQPHGLLSLFLFACGIGVGVSGVRDAFAAIGIDRHARNDEHAAPLRFGVAGQHVLVTGATGFIGQLLVRALLADAHQVTVLARRPRQAAWQFDGRVRCIASLNELPPTQAVDVVINLAGAPILGWRWSAARQAQLRASRIDLTRSLVTWIAGATHKPRLLLSASAIGYYGIQAQDDLAGLTEASPPQPIFMSQLCQDWEAAAQEASAHGVQVVRMRFGLVLGLQGALPKLLLPIQLGLGGRLGSGRQCISWIHVHDLLRALAHVWALSERVPAQSADGSVSTDSSGAYNFTAPQGVTQLQFSRSAADVLRRPCFIPTPAWPMRLALGEQAALLLDGQRVVPAALLASGFEFRYPDIHGALQNLC